MGGGESSPPLFLLDIVIFMQLDTIKYLTDGLWQALLLIVTFDREVYRVVLTSLYCSLTATILGSAVALPLGFFIGGFDFRGKASLVTLFNTFMALPTTVVGLMGYSFLSRKGPLGFLGLLFTPWAIILGETILCIPIITSFAISVTQGIDSKVRDTALTLGASPMQSYLAVIREGRIGYLVAIVAGYARVVAEVGAAMMLGGNIKGFTRTIPTAIMLETSKGEFALGIALGIILIFLAFSVNIVLHRLRALGE